MNYRKFINDSIKISEIGFGGWQLGQNSGWKSISESEAMNLVHKALDLGINFFDTAPNYGHGTGEERLGKGLKGTDRSKLVINTKFGHTHTGALNFDANYIRESLEGSLKRLQVDYVDSLIIHNPPNEYYNGQNCGHYEILERLIDEGKIRAYGASLDTFDDLKLLLDTTNSKVVEVFFNIFHQDTARGFELAKQNDVGLIVKVPLDSGWLTGKYDKNSTFTGIRSRWSPSDIETRAGLVKEVEAIVGKDDSLAQKALAFCLSYDAISTVIPGNVHMQQLTSNVLSSEIDITPKQIKALEDLYEQIVKPLSIPW